MVVGAWHSSAYESRRLTPWSTSAAGGDNCNVMGTRNTRTILTIVLERAEEWEAMLGFSDW